MPWGSSTCKYLKSPHHRNAFGMRAICSDCRVPKEWGPKLWRKIQASNELHHHLRGTVDTPKKFKAKRAEMAEHVWAAMIANDTRRGAAGAATFHCRDP